MARKALGRGMGALISKTPRKANPQAEAADDATGQPLTLALESIDPSPYQPRQNFDEEKLFELADSIREQGLIQPIVVRTKPNGRYELIAGERRMRAATHLGWEKVPTVIMEASDDNMRELALVENLQRDDLNSIETALAYQALITDSGLTHEKVAARLGVSRANISNTMRLLELPEEVKSMVAEKRISAGHARALLSLPEPLSQINMAHKIEAEKLSVREVEKLVSPKNSGASKKSPKKAQDKDTSVKNLEDRLRDHLGTKVSITDRGGKGSINIDFYSYDDVARILAKMNVPSEL